MGLALINANYSCKYGVGKGRPVANRLRREPCYVLGAMPVLAQACFPHRVMQTVQLTIAW